MSYNQSDMNQSELLSTIGRKIKEAREEQSISQKDLGMSLGLSDKAVSAYEASRTIPPLETLIRIAEELNKPIDYFIKENSSDYKVETKIASMEQSVAKMLQEIRIIREQMSEKASASDSGTVSQGQPTETSDTENASDPNDQSPTSPPTTDHPEISSNY